MRKFMKQIMAPEAYSDTASAVLELFYTMFSYKPF